MNHLQIKPIRNLVGRHQFVDVPFRIHGGDPGWIPPLRMTVYDRRSPRHPAMAHQRTALWVALRHGRPVGRIGACFDTAFNAHQGVSWAWAGFFDAFDDSAAATALFDTALEWAGQQGATTCVGPASFTTNDELGLQVDGFNIPPTIMTTQNPPYYERLWVDAGWEPAMDLLAWHFDKETTALSARQRERLDRLRSAAKIRARQVNMDDWDADVGRFFEVYNAAWQDNWGFAPMPEPEIRHLAKQLKQIINPRWAFGLETEDGEAVAVCLALPDVNPLMAKVRSGRLAPFGWAPLLAGRRKVTHARVWALGVRPNRQHLALGPLLYAEIVERLASDPYIRSAEASWTLASNTRINRQLESMGAHRSKLWRLYQRAV
jgi:GNAT superfamily N-acetyltransferase